MTRMPTEELIEYLRTVQTIRDMPDGTKLAEPSEWAVLAVERLENLYGQVKDSWARIHDAEVRATKAEQRAADIRRTVNEHAAVQSALDAARNAQSTTDVYKKALHEVIDLSRDITIWLHNHTDDKTRAGRLGRNRKLLQALTRIRAAANLQRVPRGGWFGH